MSLKFTGAVLRVRDSNPLPSVESCIRIPPEEFIDSRAAAFPSLACCGLSSSSVDFTTLCLPIFLICVSYNHSFEN